MIPKGKCAPSRYQLDSCFFESELVSLATLYNTKKSNAKKINLNHPLYIQLDNVLQQYCGPDNPKCWSTLDFLKNSPQLKYTLDNLVFKPILHKNRYTWLSTSDINTIMFQYTQFDPSFTFLGTHPSDFINLYSTSHLSNILYNCRNAKKIAIVFNLDTSNQVGSHWICVYIDNSVACPVIEYFDSLGNKPPTLVYNFILFLIDNLHKKRCNIHVHINSIVLQKKGSDCGIYVIYYILNRILNYSISDIIDSVNDSNINYFRDILYTPRD